MQPFARALDSYKRACDCGRGAILLTVARSKVVEAADFSEHYCRALIFFGVPYCNYNDRAIAARLKVSHKLAPAALASLLHPSPQAFTHPSPPLATLLHPSPPFASSGSHTIEASRSSISSTQMRCGR